MNAIPWRAVGLVVLVAGFLALVWYVSGFEFALFLAGLAAILGTYVHARSRDNWRQL